MPLLQRVNLGIRYPFNVNYKRYEWENICYNGYYFAF